MDGQELSWRERGRLWLRLGIRLALAALAWLLLTRVGLPLLSLLMPFVLALCVAWLLNPLVRLLQRRLHLSRNLISILLILLILAGVGGVLVSFIWNIAQETIALAADWSTLERELRARRMSFSRAVPVQPSRERRDQPKSRRASSTAS